MIETKGNLFTMPVKAICIPTNGMIKTDGKAVMGRGVALEAARRFPTIDILLARALEKEGNKVHDITPVTLPNVVTSYHILSFPTKHNWKDPSDPTLIAKSCVELKELVTKNDWLRVAMPRVGCGLGGLDWERVVKPIINKHLNDDRFIVVTM
jgi:O-acetyl-ADP-ribose deacetylase (regulator of RNase III)